jgi:hypothetical protein
VLAAAGVAILLFVAAWVYRFNDPGGSFAYLTDDHFFYLVRGWQILFGDLPVRDFVDHGAPLYYYVSAAVQILFGRGTLSEIVFSVTVLALGAAGVFLLAARASRSLLLGLAAAFFHVLLEPRFYNYPKIIVYVAAIPALWVFADHPDRRRAAILAVITVIGFLFRHDHGVFIAASFAVLLVLLKTLSWRERLRHAAIYGAMVVLLLSPYLAFIEWNGGVVEYFRTAATWAERDRGRAEVVWPGLFENPNGESVEAQAGNVVSRTAARIRDNGVAWVFYTELAIPIVTMMMLVAAPSPYPANWRNAVPKVAVVAALGMMLNVGFLRSPLAARLADPSVPHAILVAWLAGAVIALVSSRHRVIGKPRAIVAGAAVLAATLVLSVLAVTTTKGLHRRLEKAAFTGGVEEALNRTATMWGETRASFPLSSDMADNKPDSLIALAYYIRSCTRPTDRVFVQDYLPQVIALGERAFAGGHADNRPGFFESEADERLTLSRLERESVPVALLTAGDTLGGFRPSFPLLTRYFDQHYDNAGERVFDGRFGIRLLVRRDRTPSGIYAPLGWPCFQ